MKPSIQSRVRLWSACWASWDRARSRAGAGPAAADEVEKSRPTRGGPWRSRRCSTGRSIWTRRHRLLRSFGFVDKKSRRPTFLTLSWAAWGPRNAWTPLVPHRVIIPNAVIGNYYFFHPLAVFCTLAAVPPTPSPRVTTSATNTRRRARRHCLVQFCSSQIVITIILLMVTAANGHQRQTPPSETYHPTPPLSTLSYLVAVEHTASSGRFPPRASRLLPLLVRGEVTV